MQGYCTTTEYTGSLGYNSVSDGCLKKNQKDVPGYGGKTNVKTFRWDQRLFSGGMYVDVILVHIKTRLDLLGIQTFR